MVHFLSAAEVEAIETEALGSERFHHLFTQYGKSPWFFGSMKEACSVC